MARDDATQRFSNRVENYVRYRPHYPAALGELLARECGLAAGMTVADLGSGTGILSELFLRRGCRVLGVEPNPEMRAAGERLLGADPRFTSVAGTAEATTLPDASVDLVAAGQAFHWFDREPARAEFLRILRPGGWVVLVWNKRRKSGAPFMEAYEGLLQRWSVDYAEVDHERVTDEVVADFFAPGPVERRSFETRERMDLEASRGRLESASYVPAPGHPNHGPMIAELAGLVARHGTAGVVTYEYDTVAYFGRLVPRRPGVAGARG
ncbi:MAG TPA: class I SAM-dependent methyltransferase [Thermoanaerobaculaceae bacterium]|nr:class I SAM-dependent methyltransferase [Thermoanaerobaculaceae bacterium]